MYYRTRTYLAGDWEGDEDLIQTILGWKENGHLALDFSDAHELTQSRDSSLHCSIKKSLSSRLDASKTFILVVGEHTNTVTKGSCKDCRNYSSYFQSCGAGGYADYRSFVKYECEKAARDALEGKMRIVVIYNSLRVYKERCPEIIRNIGQHIPGKCCDAYGRVKPNYQVIKNAIMG
jgi:hypothetical protein